MAEGEQFNILEGDNEGWTLVQRMSNGEEGFVPTSFLLISWSSMGGNEGSSFLCNQDLQRLIQNNTYVIDSRFDTLSYL